MRPAWRLGSFSLEKRLPGPLRWGRQGRGRRELVWVKEVPAVGQVAASGDSGPLLQPRPPRPGAPGGPPCCSCLFRVPARWALRQKGSLFP